MFAVAIAITPFHHIVFNLHNIVNTGLALSNTWCMHASLVIQEKKPNHLSNNVVFINENENWGGFLCA